MNKKKKIIFAAAGAVCTAAAIILICKTVSGKRKPELVVSTETGSEHERIVTEKGNDLVDEDAFPEDANIIVRDFATGGEPKGIEVIREEHHEESKNENDTEKTENKSVPENKNKPTEERKVTEEKTDDLGKKSPEYLPPTGGQNPFETEGETKTEIFSAENYNSGEGCGEGIKF